MPIITVSRQYGSGGSEVAARVARALEWHLYDNEVVDEVARRLGMSVEDVSAREERVPTLPEVPTFTESGIDLGGISGGTWFGIVAPARTPASVITTLNDAVNQTLKEPKTRAAFEATSHTVVGGTPQEFGAFFRSQQTYWSTTLEAAGARPN